MVRDACGDDSCPDSIVHEVLPDFRDIHLRSPRSLNFLTVCPVLPPYPLQTSRGGSSHESGVWSADSGHDPGKMGLRHLPPSSRLSLLRDGTCGCFARVLGVLLLVFWEAMSTVAAPYLLWQDQGSPLPHSLGEVAAAVVGDRMYVVGEGAPDTFVYDIRLRAWVDNAPTRPYPGDHHGVAVIGTSIYLVGGFNGGQNGGCAVPGCQGQMQVYHTETEAWETLGPLPYHVEGSVSVAVLGGNILACSGLFHRGENEEYLGLNGDPGVNPTDCFSYDPATRHWTRFPSILTGVDHTAVGTDGEKMYVFGGRSIGRNVAGQGLDITQVYDSATKSWSYGQ